MERRTEVVATHESAARTQLETAIYLWFVEGDPLSIHTLASAALQRLHDQGMKIGKPSTILKMVKEYPTKKKRQMATLPTTFAKHADRRMPFDGVKFWMEQTEHYIYDAIICYQEQFQNLTPWMRLFAARVTLIEPETFAEIPLPNFVKRLPRYKELARLGRHQFIKKLLTVITREELGMAPANFHSESPPRTPEAILRRPMYGP